MGGNESNFAKNPQLGQANSFYWACCTGDLTTVKKMISTLTYEDINALQRNGSTALHAATYSNHYKIVKLLLERGCSTTVVNRFGNTAYEEAQNEEMRLLFKRPISPRFVDEEPTQSFGINTQSENNSNEGSEEDSSTPNSWLKGYANKSNANTATFMTAIMNASGLTRHALKSRLESVCKNQLKEMFETKIVQSDKDKRKANECLKNFMKTNDVEELLEIYTLETSLYRALQDDCEDFTALIYLHIRQLKARAYQGITYRGASMSSDDIDAYRWALASKSRVLETRTIQSTSKLKSIALSFIPEQPQPGKFSVLMVFNFNQLCPTAIDLGKLGEGLRLLSQYQDEEEVTLLPYTLFQVQSIKVDDHRKDRFLINLNYVSPEKKSVFSSLTGI